MMKKHGFTLMELLAVITIIGVITLATMPAVTRSINRSKERTYESQIKLIEDAASSHASEILSKTGYISLAEMKTKKMVQNKKIPNPRDGKPMNGCVKIIKDAYGQYKAKYEEKSCPPVKNYVVKDVIYFDPTGKVADCKAGSEWTQTRTGTTCYKWNVIRDNGSTVEMLLDHNLGNKVAWNLTNSNESGPNEIYTQLKNGTSTWMQVETLTDADTKVRGAYGEMQYRVNYEGMQARLISAQELATIGNDTVWSPSVYTGIKYTASPWLNTNLGTANTATQHIGYWTDTAVTTSKEGIWIFGYLGDLNNRSANTTASYGVRPVVRVLKSVL